MKKGLLLIISAVFTVYGCKTKETRFVFEHVHIPSVIQDKAEQREYLSYHYWDNMPWEDTSLLITPILIKQPYFEYLSVISELGLSKAEDRLKELAAKSSSSSKSVSEAFLQLFEETLDHPNSPMKHEKLYMAVLNEYIRNLNSNDPLKEKLNWDRELLNKNKVGDVCEDFKIVFTDGSVNSLHSISSEYILIFFFEPDCRVCKESLEYAQKSDIINRFKERNMVLAIYSGENITLFEEVAGSFPGGWRVGHDLNNMIALDRLYDRRASPSVFILDKEKKVLLKDGDIESAEALINKLLAK